MEISYFAPFVWFLCFYSPYVSNSLSSLRFLLNVIFEGCPHYVCILARSKSALSSRRTLLKADSTSKSPQTQKVTVHTYIPLLSIMCTTPLKEMHKLDFMFTVCCFFQSQKASSEPVYPSLAGCDSPVEDILPVLSPCRL